jgi:SAM-dependent methyltransferase
MAGRLISGKHSQKDDWNKIWNAGTVINKFVDFGRKIYNIRFLSILKNHIKVNTFCELGCGSSTLLAKIAGFSQHVVGIDYADGSLRLSKSLFEKLNITNGSFVNDDCRNLRVKKKFDTVWSQGLVEHFSDPAAIIQQHLKITKKGGHTIISVPYKYGYTNMWYKLTRPTFLKGFWPWTQQLFFSEKMLKENLKKYCPEQTDHWIRTYPLMGIIVLFVHKK